MQLKLTFLIIKRNKVARYYKSGDSNPPKPDNFKYIIYGVLVCIIILLGVILFLLLSRKSENMEEKQPMEYSQDSIENTTDSNISETTLQGKNAQKDVEKSKEYTMSDFIRGINAVRNDNLLSISSYSELLKREGFKEYRDVGHPRLDQDGEERYPYVYSRGCRAKDYVDNYADEFEVIPRYVPSSPNEGAVIVEILAAGDGTIIELNCYSYGKNIAKRWVEQLKNLGYSDISFDVFEGLDQET